MALHHFPPRVVYQVGLALDASAGFRAVSLRKDQLKLECLD